MAMLNGRSGETTSRPRLETGEAAGQSDAARRKASASLFGIAGFAPLDSPLDSLFKERLFVSLSRFCDARYCLVRHAGFLLGLGHGAGDGHAPRQKIEEIIRLVSRPLPRSEHLDSFLAALSDCRAPIGEVPAPDSPCETAVFACAAHVFLQTAAAARCLDALRRTFGESEFQSLLVFLAFARAVHFWTKTQTGLRLEDDVIKLLADNGRLTGVLLNDPEAMAFREIGAPPIEEVAALRAERHRGDKRLRLERELSRSSDTEIRRADAELTARVAELQRLNDEVRDSRRAALNVMEDALLSKEALRESEEKYRTLFDSIDEGFAIEELVYDGDGRIEDIIFREVNRAYERQGGLTGVVGKSIKEVLPNLEQHWKDMYARVAETGEPVRMVNYAQDVDRWFDTSLTMLAGSDKYVAVVFNDITERKRREAEQECLLKLSDALRPLSDAAEIKAAAVRLLGEHLGVNRAFYADAENDHWMVATGYEQNVAPLPDAPFAMADFGQWIIENFRAGRPLIVPDARTEKRFKASERAALEALQIVGVAGVPLVKQDTLAAMLCLHTTTPRDWNEQEMRLMQEVAERTWAATERARAENALRESEKKYRTLFDTMVEGFCIIQMIYDADDKPVDWRFLTVNPAFERHNGLSDAAGKTIREMTPDIEPKWMEIYSQVAVTGESLHFEEQSEALGRSFDLNAFRVGEPEERKLAVFFTNNTVLKQTELALRGSEEKFSALFEASPAPFLVIRPDAPRFIITEVNDAYLAATLRTRDEVVGRGIFEAYPDNPDDAVVAGVSTLRASLDRVLASRQPDRLPAFKYDIARPDGTFEERWWRPVNSPVLDENGEVKAIIHNANDVTEEHLAEGAERERQERQAFLLGFSDAIRALESPLEIEQAAMRLLGEHLNATRAFYFLTEPAVGGDWIHIIESDYRRDPGMPSHAGRHSVSDFGLKLFEGAERGQVVAVEDVTKVPILTSSEIEKYLAVDVSAFINVPLIKDGKFVAGIGAHDSSPRPWKSAEIALIQEVAERTWAAVGRARAEEALRASEERARALIANLPGGAAFVVSREGRYVMAEGDALLAGGLTPADFLGKTLDEALPPEQRALHRELYRRAFAGEPFETEHFSYGRWFLTRGVPLRGGDGGVMGALAVSYDITARRQVEAALRASEERFRTLADAVPQVIWTNTADGTADYFNRRWYDYTGLGYEQSAGPGWQAVVHPDDAPASVEKWQRALAAGTVFDTEYRLRGADGEFRWFLGRNVPLKNEAGAVIAWFGSATDIEEWKQVQAARQESEERFRLLVEGARDYAMFLLDTDGRITFWSAGAERILGYTEAEALGQPVALIFTPEDRQQGEPDWEREQARVSGQAIDRRWHLRRDGTRFWADGMLMRLDDEKGTLRGFAKVMRDASDQWRAEEEARRALEAVAEANAELERRVEERTARWREAAAARQDLTHRLVGAEEEERRRLSRELHDQTGQHLTGLLLGLDALRASQPAGSEPAALAERLRQAAADLSREVHQLAWDLRPPALDDIGLSQTLLSYVQEWGERQGVAADFFAPDWGGDRLAPEVETALYRVVQEALTNVARHARAARVSVVLERREDGAVLVVEDDGAGFDVAATLASPARLGLRGMRERVEMVGGTLEIESSGGGTTLAVHVPPRAQETAAEVLENADADPEDDA